MALGPVVTSYLALALIAFVGIAQSVPKSLVKRQISGELDTSHISDEALLECFALLAQNLECNNLVGGGPPPVEVPHVTESPGCTCVPSRQCEDFNPPTANTGDGGLLALVNVRTTCADPFDTCCINISPSTVRPPPPPAPLVSTCGQLKPEGVDSTFVGFQENQAQFGQFPWMAAVMTTGIAGANGANVYVCGGSLIHPRVIATAAHYMEDYKADQLAVRLGEWNFKLPTEPIRHQDIRVRRIAIHPGYVTNQLTYDVALLFLENDAVLGPTVGTICLPDPFETFDNERCYVSGWGKDIFEQGGKYQQILKALEVPYVSHPQCQSDLRRTRLGPTFNLHKSFACAGGEGTDACTGDGGSPLVCPKKDGSGYVQAGVVAWGIGCGQVGVPGVYASVPEAVDWIGQELLTNMNFDIRVGNKKR